MLAPWVLALGLLAPAQTNAAQDPGGAPTCREIASAECLGGAFRSCAFTADARRLLTLGELGDLILWDTASGAPLKRYPALTRWARLMLHPTQPWALVAGRGKEPAVWRLDLGSGRTQMLWREPLLAAGCERGGERVGVLLGDRYGEQRLAIYPAMALLARELPPPDSVYALHDAPADSLVFAPDGRSVVLSDFSRHVAVPLLGGDLVAAEGAVAGFDAAGVPLINPDPGRELRSADGACRVRPGPEDIERLQPDPCTWQLPARDTHPNALVVAAGNGMVAAGDGQGWLELLGPETDRRRMLAGHRGTAIDLVFSPDGRQLAVVGGSSLVFLDLATRQVRRLAGTWGVLAGEQGAGFRLLGSRELRTFDAATHRFGSTILAWPTGPGASCVRRFWTQDFTVSPACWTGPGTLWLGGLQDSRRGDGPLAAAAGGATPAEVPLPDDDRAHRNMLVSAIAPVAGGGVLVAQCTPPLQCGTGLDRLEFFAAVRRISPAREVAQTRWFPRGACWWLSLTPDGTRAALDADAAGNVLLIDARTLATVGEHVFDPPVTQWVFQDDRHALASDGRRVLRIDVQAWSTTPLRLPDLPGPITRIAWSPRGRLLAIACSADVRVFHCE